MGSEQLSTATEPTIPSLVDCGQSPVLVADMGGTRLRVALVSSEGEIISKEEHPTPKGGVHPEMLVNTLASLAAVGEPVEAVVGVPGPIDYDEGALLWAPHLPPAWVGGLTSSALSESLGLSVSLANDADLATVGECWFGAGREYGDVAYVTVSTGVGAGVVLRRRLVRGRRSLAELGHMVIETSSLWEARPATVEELGSGSAIEARGRESNLGMSAADVAGLARAGSSEAQQIWRNAARYVAVGIHNLCLLFAPELVVLGGGVGRSEGFADAVREEIFEVASSGRSLGAELAVAALGDDAGLVGGAGWLEATSPQAWGSGR